MEKLVVPFIKDDCIYLGELKFKKERNIEEEEFKDLGVTELNFGKKSLKCRVSKEDEGCHDFKELQSGFWYNGSFFDVDRSDVEVIDVEKFYDYLKKTDLDGYSLVYYASRDISDEEKSSLSDYVLKLEEEFLLTSGADLDQFIKRKLLNSKYRDVISSLEHSKLFAIDISDHKIELDPFIKTIGFLSSIDVTKPYYMESVLAFAFQNSNAIEELDSINRIVYGGKTTDIVKFKDAEEKNKQKIKKA